MAGSSKRTKVDPELTRQLEEAGADDRSVQAVVYLRSSQRSINPDSVNETAKRVIDSASTKAGTGPARVNVMRYIGTVAVEGPASFVRALIAETEVSSALANVHPGDDPGLGKPSAGGDRSVATDDAPALADEEASPDHEDAEPERAPAPAKSAAHRKTRSKSDSSSAGSDADMDRPAAEPTDTTTADRERPAEEAADDPRPPS